MPLPLARAIRLLSLFLYIPKPRDRSISTLRVTAAPDLQRIFAEIILKFDDLDELAEDNRVYALDTLADRVRTQRKTPSLGRRWMLLEMSMVEAGGIEPPSASPLQTDLHT